MERLGASISDIVWRYYVFLLPELKLVCILLIDDVIIGRLVINMDPILTTTTPDEDWLSVETLGHEQ